jgi:uncharacterized protein YcgI (DUF1989 family)
MRGRPPIVVAQPELPTSPHTAIDYVDALPPLPTSESFCTNAVLTRHVVPASHGYAFSIPAGSRFRVIDIYGEQVVDMQAWAAPSSSSSDAFSTLERMSMAYTRYHLSGVTPAIGECLWTNADRPLLRVTADTVKVHDMTFMSCFPELYLKKGIEGHRSCAGNIFEAMQPFGMKHLLETAEPFNIFQNTPNYSLKRLGSSKPGDYIEFEALQDAVIAVSSCPYDLDGFNGGKVTDVAVVIAAKKSNVEM